MFCDLLDQVPKLPSQWPARKIEQIFPKRRDEKTEELTRWCFYMAGSWKGLGLRGVSWDDSSLGRPFMHFNMSRQIVSQYYLSLNPRSNIFAMPRISHLCGKWPNFPCNFLCSVVELFCTESVKFRADFPQFQKHISHVVVGGGW